MSWPALGTWLRWLGRKCTRQKLFYPGPPEKDAVTAGQQRWLMSLFELAEHRAIAPCSTKGSEWTFLLKLRILKIGAGQSTSTLQETVATTAASCGSYDQIRP